MRDLETRLGPSREDALGGVGEELVSPRERKKKDSGDSVGDNLGLRKRSTCSPMVVPCPLSKRTKFDQDPPLNNSPLSSFSRSIHIILNSGTDIKKTASFRLGDRVCGNSR